MLKDPFTLVKPGQPHAQIISRRLRISAQRRSFEHALKTRSDLTDDCRKEHRCQDHCCGSRDRVL